MSLDDAQAGYTVGFGRIGDGTLLPPFHLAQLVESSRCSHELFCGDIEDRTDSQKR